MQALRLPFVTPHVGVRIETYDWFQDFYEQEVTPHVGVRIETLSALALRRWARSHLT